MKNILIIEDDISIAELEKDYLEASGFSCRIIHDGTEGLSLASKEPWDLIILDLMLPGSDGFTICREIRDHIDIPILMVSAQKDDIDKIRALGLGADDYITKPFSPAELTARVKAHISRYERLKASSEASKVLSIRGVTIQPEQFTVIKLGVEVNLTSKEFEILDLLMSNADKVFSKEEIFERVWKDNHGDLSTVTVHVRKLREKLEANPSKPEFIETIWGIGYRIRSLV
jgi:two-component system OmpR family response regulator